MSLRVIPAESFRSEARVGSEPIRVDDATDLLELGAASPPDSKRGVAFPPPSWIQRYYEAVLKMEESEKFKGRTGPSPKPDNLVPACVAWFLAQWAAYGRWAMAQAEAHGLDKGEYSPSPTKGWVGGRKEIHTLLNKHVLRADQEKLPEEGYSSSSANRLWRDVDRVACRLRNAYDDFSNPAFDECSDPLTYDG